MKINAKYELKQEVKHEYDLLEISLKYYNISLLIMAVYGLLFILDRESDCTYYINIIMLLTSLSYFIIRVFINRVIYNELYVNWIRVIFLFSLGDIVYIFTKSDSFYDFILEHWENRFKVFFKIFEVFFVVSRTLVLFLMFCKFSKRKYKNKRLFNWVD